MQWTVRIRWVRQSPPRRPSPRRLRSARLVAFICALLSFSAAPAARAATTLSAVEIEPRVEAALDARALRRLIKLELGDLDVPPRRGRDTTALFVRVLTAPGGEVRVELWELGELYGERVVLRGRGSPQLVARRVALAVAELARNLRKRRHAEDRAELRARRQERREALAAYARTQEGPLALRTALEGDIIGPLDLALAGTSVYGQITVGGRLRLDLGASLLTGLALEPGTPAQALELGLGPARRVVLTPALDLDLAARARAGMLLLGGVTEVDAIPGQREVLWARADVVARLEPRVTRSLRLSFGVLAGLVLRGVSATSDESDRLRFGGIFAGFEAGVVFTPPSPRAK